ncbi:MAG: glycoside hydrolase family 3 C-terminal domain-containing protein [Dysgonamonadaceae bacterium]|jgi:beta-glucosidase|nr:glycoside hydrolase family 3 C-terminal domain-containing protein [Dysgonamonadaceae bacterium]
MKSQIKLSFLLLTGILACFSIKVNAQSDRNISVLSNYDARIDTILAQMTLEEKVNMFFGIRMFSSAGVPRLGIADVEYADGPFGIREELMPNSWMPAGLGNDLATFFPTGSALAATWCPESAYDYGVAIGTEGRTRGKDMLLGPAINIQRIPTGGRTYEYLSEDPFLSARLSVGYTKGVQDQGIAACIKHYALNNQENNRGKVDVIVSPRTMREIYLPPFEAAVKEADAWGVMAAYNKVNGYWCSENDLLQNQILRNEWGFAGFIVSDWGGTHSTVAAITNGLNVEMPTGQYLGDKLLDSVRAGVVSEEIINQRACEILRVRLHVKPVPPHEANRIMTSQPRQQQIAYEVASKAIVLLKNEKTQLPLDTAKYKKIAVIGANAMQKNATGGLGAGVKALFEITPLQGLRDRLGNQVTIVYAPGYKPYRRYQEGTRTRQPECTSADPDLLKEAVNVAKDADIVLFFGGTNRDLETEGTDRESICLPSGQDELIKALAEVNPNIVSIIVSGAPVDLRAVNQYSPAILMSWFNGSAAGHALADVLLGTISPSGKLPFTLPVKLEDSPAYFLRNYPQTGEANSDIFADLVNENRSELKSTDNKDLAYYSEESLVGYRWFDTKNIKPMFPFGHGLSYTTFQYASIKTDKAKYKSDETIKVSVDLTNSGKADADEVVQIYVHRLKSKVFWPYKELKAFDRVNLKAGETKKLTLEIPVKNLRYWDEAKYDWILENGAIEILVGTSSGDIRLKTQVDI